MENRLNKYYSIIKKCRYKTTFTVPETSRKLKGHQMEACL
jgi:hypothetical protein